MKKEIEDVENPLAGKIPLVLEPKKIMFVSCNHMEICVLKWNYILWEKW